MSRPSNMSVPDLAARRRSLFWRIHFWAALIASPFTLVAALTGLVYVFTPQIEDRLYGHLEHVAPAGAMAALDTSVAAARAAAPPGLELKSVGPPASGGGSVKALFGPPAAQSGEHQGHAQHGQQVPVRSGQRPNEAGKLVVFVDPYSGQVLGSQMESDRFSEWARRLHSRLLQGEGWRWPIELAASWLMVMLLTGIYLWWPRAGQPALPRQGRRGRLAWRQWHAFIGVLLSALSFTMVATGITWSKYAGENVRALRDASGQGPVPAPRNLHSMPMEGARPMTWQQAWDAARAQAPGVAMQLTSPRGAHGVWRATAADRGQPAQRFDLVLNAYTGKPLYYAGWDRQTAFGKATAIGIPFHRGEFGVWNQALLLLFAAGVLFSMGSGWVMFFKRRRAGLAVMPRLLPGAWRSMPVAAALVGLALIALMPLLALSAAVVAFIEFILAKRKPDIRGAGLA